MSDIYTEKFLENGRVQYRKNGKLISRERYLEGRAINDEPTQDFPVLPDETLAEAKNTSDNIEDASIKKCFFCDEPGVKQRMANLKTYNLCAGHYHTKTLGQIVQHERELNGHDSEPSTPEPTEEVSPEPI